MRNKIGLHPTDVIERRDVERRVRVSQAVLHDAVHGDGEVVSLGVKYALRPTGRAGGIDERSEVILCWCEWQLAPIDGFLREGFEVRKVVAANVAGTSTAADEHAYAVEMLASASYFIAQGVSVNEGSRARIAQDFREFRGGESEIDGDRHSAEKLSREI